MADSVVAVAGAALHDTTEKVAKTILLLGGYGGAGLPVARLLLRETGVRLIVAGRDRNRAEGVAKQLNAECGAERVAGMRVDAADRAGLEPAFRQCDLVTVCAPMTGIGSGVMEAACSAEIDYVGLNVEMTAHEGMETLSKRVAQKGLLFLTDAGLVPGVPAVLARHAAGRFETVEEITVGAIVRERNLSYGSAVDIMAATATPAAVYEGGQWRPPSLTTTRRIDFGPDFGVCTCYPMYLPELRPLPGLLGLRRCAGYAAGVNGFANAVAAIRVAQRVPSFGPILNPAPPPRRKCGEVGKSWWSQFSMGSFHVCLSFLSGLHTIRSLAHWLSRHD